MYVPVRMGENGKTLCNHKVGHPHPAGGVGYHCNTP